MIRVLLSPVIKVINHMNQVPMCVLLKQAVGWWFVQTSFRFLKSFRSDHWSTIRGRWVPRSDMMTGWPWLKWNTLTRFGHQCTSSSKFQPEILGRPGVSSAFLVLTKIPLKSLWPGNIHFGANASNVATPAYFNCCHWPTTIPLYFLI